MKSRLHSLVRISLAAAALWAAEARATVWLFGDELTAASPTFTIDGAATNPLSLYNGVHPYELLSFQLSDPATLTFQVTGSAVGASGPLVDPAVLLFQGTFGAGGYTPATLLPYVGGNDDIDTGVNRSSSLTLSLLANTTYTLVLTTWESDLGAATYGESQYGGFQTSIDSGASTTTLTVIPEPRTYGLLLSLCTGVVVAVRGGRRCFVRA